MAFPCRRLEIRSSDYYESRRTVELTRRRESKHSRRTKQVEKHAPAARAQRFLICAVVRKQHMPRRTIALARNLDPLAKRRTVSLGLIVSADHPEPSIQGP